MVERWFPMKLMLASACRKGSGLPRWLVRPATILATLTLLQWNSIDARADSPVERNATPHAWPSERLHDVVQRQLTSLAEVIGPCRPASEQSRSTAGAAAAAILTPDFRCEPLRPKLRNVSVHEQFVVLTAAEASQRVAGLDATQPGQERWKRAVAGLRSPFKTGSDVRIHFKVIRLENSGNSIRTEVLYQASGSGHEGRLQQNARWHCVWHSERGPSAVYLHLIRVMDFQEVHLKGRDTPAFSDGTDTVFGFDAGYRDQLSLSIDDWRGRIPADLGIAVTGHHGLAIGDVNGDSLADLYVCQPGGLPNRLYLQNADATVTDVSTQAGVDWLDNTHSALFADLDNDGDQDLIVGSVAGLLILENDGAAHFSPHSASTRRRPTMSPPSSLAVADYDMDGDLDIYVCVYSRSPYMTTGLLSHNSDRHAVVPVPYHDATNGGRNILFRNDGEFRLVDVTAASGLDANNHRFSLAAAWEDFDQDGDSDLYVANDFGRNNLYLNEDGRFEDAAAAAGVEDIGAGMSCTWGDANNDGRPDLYVSNMFSSAGNRITFQQQFKTDSNEETRRQFQRHARGNSLFINAGDGTFEDSSVQAGVTVGGWAWGSTFLDWNNDGREDLFVANGYLTQEDSGDL